MSAKEHRAPSCPELHAVADPLMPPAHWSALSMCALSHARALYTGQWPGDLCYDPAPATRPVPTAPRLIATDLDGTLLRDDKTVSDRTIAALAAAEEAGIEVFFVTGRPARWMDVVSAHVHGHGLAICGNGAAVVDLHGDSDGHRFVKVRPLERAAALDVVTLLRAAVPGTSFAVERTGGFHHELAYPPMHLDPAASVAPAEKLLADGRRRGRPAGAQGARLPPRTGPGRLPRAGPHGGRGARRGHPVQPDRAPGDQRRGRLKASTLALCCAERGISPAEVVAFGDMPNDMEMLSWAGTSYAMGNAHPDVLATASGRTVANNEDGVAVVIEQILKAR